MFFVFLQCFAHFAVAITIVFTLNLYLYLFNGQINKTQESAGFSSLTVRLRIVAPLHAGMTRKVHCAPFSFGFFLLIVARLMFIVSC